MFKSSLISLCLKLYVLNILQYSKLRPICLLKNQSFPFITPSPSTSTTLSAVTTLSTGTTLSSGTTASNLSTTATTPLTPVTTVSNAPVTNTSIITTTPIVTTNPTTILINTRQKKSPVLSKNGYQYINSHQQQKLNCPATIEYCLSDGNGGTRNCPCFDIRSGSLKSQKTKGRTCIGPERDVGSCTSLEKCPLIVEEYYSILVKRPNLSYEEFLILSKCRETTDQICCPIRN